MSVLPARAFVRVSRGFQLILLAALVLLFLTFPVLFPSINVMLSEQNSLMLCFPPSWFLGLYELLLGYSGETFTSLGRLAGLGLAALATSSLALYGFAYGRHVSRTLESRELSPSHCLPVFASLASSIRLVRNLREMAVFQFLCQTLGRSQRHRLILTVCFGFGLALIFTALVQLSLGRADPTVSLCSIPLILSFVTLAGLRISFTLPAMLSANWIFQISESESNDRSLLAVWKLMVLGGILPCLLLVPLYLYLWPPKQVALQLTFVSVLSLVLIEFLLFNFRKIPYTCAYLPGKSNLKLMWVVYLGLFSTYAYSMASLEAWLFDHPAYFGLFLAISALLAVSLFLRRHTILRGARLVYKEESVPPVQPLVLKR
jgi:hypothetical protein